MGAFDFKNYNTPEPEKDLIYETVEEFLARGGKITYLEAPEFYIEPEATRWKSRTKTQAEIVKTQKETWEAKRFINDNY